MIKVRVDKLDAATGKGADDAAVGELLRLRDGLVELLRREEGRGAIISSVDGDVSVEVPEAVLEAFDALVSTLAAQGSVSIVGSEEDLSTQQVADLLNVSRQYVVRVMDEGRLAHHLVGAHRRAYLRDVLTFKRRRDLKRSGALTKMVRLSEESGAYVGERKQASGG